jgi:hypothetical protein
MSSSRLGKLEGCLASMGVSDNICEGTLASSFADDYRLQRGSDEEHDCKMLRNDLDKWTEEIFKN